jgi:hypothetical protein
LVGGEKTKPNKVIKKNKQRGFGERWKN